jgi:hypothetical protein
MKACPKCMTENTDTAKFCKQCASPLQQAGGKTCPSGRHTMDPTWTECVYCKQENAAPIPGPVPPVRTPTVVEGAPRKATEIDDMAGRGAPLPPRPPKPVATKPVQGAAPQPPRESRDATVFRPMPTQDSSAAPSAGQGRKIVGILISYSWNPEGKIYAVYEGRNIIGREEKCEISVPEDKTLSANNTHITYRKNFVVGDMISMGGTYVDGVPIEEQFRGLDNYATIQAGSTYFTFIVIKPQSAADPAKSGDVTV